MSQKLWLLQPKTGKTYFSIFLTTVSFVFNKKAVNCVNYITLQFPIHKSSYEQMKHDLIIMLLQIWQVQRSSRRPPHWFPPCGKSFEQDCQSWWQRQQQQQETSWRKELSSTSWILDKQLASWSEEKQSQINCSIALSHGYCIRVR